MSDERMSDETGMPRHQARRVRHARELQDHLNWLDTFSGTALGVLAVAHVLGLDRAMAADRRRRCKMPVYAGFPQGRSRG